jgi:hypothetical protein
MPNDFLTDDTTAELTELFRLDEAFPPGGRNERKGLWHRFRNWLSNCFRPRRRNSPQGGYQRDEGDAREQEPAAPQDARMGLRSPIEGVGAGASQVPIGGGGDVGARRER